MEEAARFQRPTLGRRHRASFSCWACVSLTLHLVSHFGSPAEALQLRNVWSRVGGGRLAAAPISHVLSGGGAGGDAPPPDLFHSNLEARNSRPLIGILSQPGDGDGGETMNGSRHRNGAARCETCTEGANGTEIYSYIAASYVKWVEMAGARAVPIVWDEPAAVVEQKLRSVNGLLLPGGGQTLNASAYMAVVARLFAMALAANDAGDYFPVWGTCMGFEEISIVVSKNFSILDHKGFDAENFPGPLNFVAPWARERMLFKLLSEGMLRAVGTKDVAMENHEDGMTVERFKSSRRLDAFFHILTTTADKKRKVYVSTAEARKYPVYVTQWHPEKPAFEFGLSNIPHTPEALAVTQAAANFFVNEARRSGRPPLPDAAADEMLIYNYSPIFSGKDGQGFFDQSYVFEVPRGSLQTRARAIAQQRLHHGGGGGGGGGAAAA